MRISLPDQTTHAVTIRIIEDHMKNTQINHSIETMEIDLELDLSTMRMETGETLEIFLVLHRLKGETSPKTIHTPNQEVTNLTILLSADLTIDLALVLRLTNKNCRKTIARRHPMWSASIQPSIPLMNYQTFAR